VLATGHPFPVEVPLDAPRWRGATRKLAAWRWGEGPTVLLVHGWEGRGSQMAAFVEPLVERGFSVVAFDVPGHGDAPPGLASLVEHARALLSVGAHLGPLHAVIAHSVGGAAALFGTRLGFDAGRLALVAPPTSPARFAAGFGAAMGLSPDLLSAVVARLERRYGMSMADLDVVRDAERFTRPLLVVHDCADRVVAVEDGESLAKAAPAGRFVTTEGLGHSRILRAPEVLETVIPFVADGAEKREAASLAAEIEADLFYRHRRW
jgi:pimeloyl-ACP methyl ester carboxylesterase